MPTERKPERNVHVITNDNFDQEVRDAKVPVLIDFWASWCGPCRALSPVIESLAEEIDDVKFGKINVDENKELAQEFGVNSIPALILFENGQEVNRSVGAIPKRSVLKLLEH